jgi:hypothetical protein
LLIIKENCYYDAFNSLIDLKRKLTNEIVSTSSFFVLGWDLESKDFFKDTPKIMRGHVLKIPAIVYAKLKSPVPSVAISKLNIDPSLWNKMFSHNLYQFRRAGWLDECLSIESETIHDIMKAVIGLNNENSDTIAHTSTLLLYPSEGGK